eukprot:TRINITY_DN4795_c0_g1_i1.p1 TRINITY_DN4795_c0_g1~~TRINITY_DN4795_c0_g1_i1.p1  ORF type:complete len:103 (+),score=13.17 TRINITY_DN4795_c0_g1_i1:62-370(+)
MTRLGDKDTKQQASRELTELLENSTEEDIPLIIVCRASLASLASLSLSLPLSLHTRTCIHHLFFRPANSMYAPLDLSPSLLFYRRVLTNEMPINWPLLVVKL